jgi:hypothetical protein
LEQSEKKRLSIRYEFTSDKGWPKKESKPENKKSTEKKQSIEVEMRGRREKKAWRVKCKTQNAGN